MSPEPDPIAADAGLPWAGDRRWGTREDPERTRLVLSLWQPWASLVIAGAKRIETRSWTTKHRGTLLIHAAAARPSVPFEVDKIATELLGPRWFPDVPRGAILGEVVLRGCFPIETAPIGQAKTWTVAGELVGLREFVLGHYAPGRFGWVIDAPRQFEAPVPFSGRQKLFSVPWPIPSTREARA